jgi:hypothetical protein
MGEKLSKGGFRKVVYGYTGDENSAGLYCFGVSGVDEVTLPGDNKMLHFLPYVPEYPD